MAAVPADRRNLKTRLAHARQHVEDGKQGSYWLRLEPDQITTLLQWLARAEVDIPGVRWYERDDLTA